MIEDNYAVYSLLVTMDDYSQPTSLFFPYRKADAETWLALLKEHPHIIAIQLLKDGKRQDYSTWTREGLSTVEMLKALGM